MLVPKSWLFFDPAVMSPVRFDHAEASSLRFDHACRGIFFADQSHGGTNKKTKPNIVS
jgi:hypothetical protein